MTDQDALIPLDGVPRRAGATERAVRASIEAAALDSRDAGAAELAAQLAAAVDNAGARKNAYAAAVAGRELAAVLTRLRLDPQSRYGNDAGQLEAFLEGLAAQ